MFIVTLEFAENRNQAEALLDAHNDWIQKAFDEGILLLIGTLEPNIGGTLIAHNISFSELKARLNDDPFVAERVVTAQIFECSPLRADSRLEFLLG